MKYRKLWEILIRRAIEMAQSNENEWIGKRLLEEMDAAEYEYHEELIVPEMTIKIERMETEKECGRE